MLVSLPSLSFSYTWTPIQRRVLTYAKLAGDSINFPETLQAIALQESSAGNGYSSLASIVGDNGYSVGPTQLQVQTTREVLDRNPSLYYFIEPASRFSTLTTLRQHIHRLSTQHLQEELLYNLRFHFAVTAELFRYHFDRAVNSGLSRVASWRKAVRAHNAGWTGSAVSGYQYLQNVIKYVKFIRKNPPVYVTPRYLISSTTISTPSSKLPKLCETTSYAETNNR